MTAGATWLALGTTARVVVTEADALAAARAAVEAELDATDRACSRFRSDSELSLANGVAGTPVEVSARFAHAVAVALRVARATGGLVDPTLGGDMRRAGYDRDFSLLPAPDPTVPVGATGEPDASRERSRPAAAWRAVEVDELLGIVRVPPGAELDLGATAKALAADRAAQAAHARTGAGVLVSLGGDVAVAGEPPAGGWTILVGDDHAAAADRTGQTVTILSGGLATSGTSVRRWQTSSGPRHHILDPRTGSPARSPWRTASVAAASCVDANAASTAAIVRGADAPRWLQRAGLPARLVSADGSALQLCGWPADGRMRRVAVLVPWEERC